MDVYTSIKTNFNQLHKDRINFAEEDMWINLAQIAEISESEPENETFENSVV